MNANAPFKPAVSTVRPLSLRIGLAAVTVGAMALGGCSDAGRVAALEQRVEAVEAKADSADKRAQAAQAMADHQPAAPAAEPEDGNANQDFPDGDHEAPAAPPDDVQNPDNVNAAAPAAPGAA